MKSPQPLVAALSIALIATACAAPASAPSTPQAPATQKAAEAQTAPAASGEKVTLNMWVFEGEETFLPELKKEFEAQHPNITLEITEIPEDQYVTKIDTALAAGASPDLGFVYEPKWIKAGKFIPLDEMIAQKGIDTKEFNQGALAANCLMNGKVYCLGTYTGAVLLFYNKGLFDAAGLPYPAANEAMTIDDYAQLAAKLSKKSDDVAQRVWGGSSGVHYWWMDWRTTMSEDGRTVKGVVDSDATVHTYDVLSKMVKDGSAMSTSDSQALGADPIDVFLQGKQAMIIIDNIVAIDRVEHMTDTIKLNAGAAPVPVRQKSDKPWVASWTDSWGVFSDSKHPAEAQEFIAFMAGPGNEMRMKTQSALPLNLKLAEEKNWAGSSELRKEALQATNLARPNIFVPGYWDAIGPLDDAFNEMVDGSKTAKQAIEDAVPQMQDRLDKAWATWDSIK